MMDTPQALFITFVAQSIVVFASNAGKFGGMTNVEVGEEYPTLFMPARWAFAIWGVIYTLETVAFGNLYLAELASLEMVQLVPDGAIAHLVVANACQLLWALAFTFEHLLASTLFMAGLAYSLTAAALGLDGGPLHVLAVATSLHAGWVCAALLLNLNLAAVQLHVHDTVTRQAVDLTLVFGSLYAAFGIGAAVALQGNAPLPLAIAWALAGIAAEKTTSAVGAKYTRAAVKYTSILLAGGLAVIVASKML